MSFCKSLQNLDIQDLVSQLATAKHCYKTNKQQTCCLCGKKCKFYFIIYRRDEQMKWKILQQNDNLVHSINMCVIGDCCTFITN
jgi:hypothetical protein